jgi:serine/threonine-protein kinase
VLESPEGIEQRIGQVIGRWTLESFLGSGATATVYRASAPDGQRAAVKLLLPELAAQGEMRSRFGREARVVASLDHPAIVRLLDHDVQAASNAYIAFEYLEGETLASRVERERLPVREVISIAEQVLDALSVAHAAGVIHRDLKPSNVFLLRAGGVKVLDFGVARVTAEIRTSIGTRLGMAIGTTAYMAPEQALGKHDSIDGRSDLFSLGAMLFRLLSGEPVHPAKTATEALEQTASMPARSLGAVAPELPDELIAIVDLSLAFAQSARYQDARAMQHDLRAWLEGAPTSVAESARASREQATVVPVSVARVAAEAMAPTVMASSGNAATELEAPARPPRAGDETQALIGQTLAGRYRVDALLGEGGMGAVYRAEHVHMKKHVALKVLHREMTAMPQVVQRFEREAVAAARIDHPHVAGAKDFGKLEDGSFYLALEYVEGSSLRQLLRAGQRLEPARIRTVIAQMASALAAAHRLGVVHRDLKPENIMLVARGDAADFVKVLDFGIAKLTREETVREPALTQMGAVFGTPEYMSPEQAMGNAVDAKSDIYSVGIILYELLAGKTPFAGRGTMAVLTGHMTEEPPALPESTVPDLRALTRELLAKQPDARPTAVALWERLAEPLDVELARPASSARFSALARRASALGRRYHERAVSVWRRWAEPLERRMRQAGIAVPLWLVAALALGCLLIGIVLAATLGGAPEQATGPSGASGPSEASHASRPGAPVIAADMAAPEAVKRDIARIEALPVYKRSYDDWLLLARGHATLGKYKESTLAYQAVLSLKASMRDDPELLEHMHRAAYDDESFNLVLNLCSTRLKQPGIDLLWTLWQEWRHDSKRAEQAELLQKKLVVLSRRASRELRTAIELATSDSCSKLQQAVERGVKYADMRAVASLEALSEKTGCGAAKAEDCYPCLRSDDNLERALARAKSHPVAPSK